ncbi:hypothetical protein KR054_007004 [Drosophila jambulina]|nr:hypothetical protein KR054_007004 [Drosophila jambulina]
MSNSQANAGSSCSAVADESIQQHTPAAPVVAPANASCPATPASTQQQAAPHIVGASTADAASGIAIGVGVGVGEGVGVGVGANLDSSPRESGDDSEDESEILEESPCGRWLKRREEVDQRDVPGIDCVHLAMDTEEGVEVVWNEVQYASLQELKSQEEKMRQVFDNLLQLDHQNIVKFHRYWTDTQQVERPRVVFITEYMSSGSLKQFLKRTKRNAKRLPLESWRRWCTQILSALSYLHSCSPPIIHGNLTCDSIFIQHNGLVKIGSVVPDAVHYSVRRGREREREREREQERERGAHYFQAPEYGAADQLTAALDIYAFGMCALEMAALEIQPSNSESTAINEETIQRTIFSLESDLQRDLIRKCLNPQPQDRPSANDLLFHPLLFEVHSLKLLTAHCLVFSPANRTMFSETAFDGLMQRYYQPDVIMAQLRMAGGQERQYRLADVSGADKLEKFVEDVKYGVYPLITYSGKKPPNFRSRAASPERADSVKSATPEPVDTESRRIVNMMCSVKIKEDSNDIIMTILLRMDDKMNRQLTCQVNENDTAADLTSELVRLGFVHLDDQDKIQVLLEETLKAGVMSDGAGAESSGAGVTTTATMAALQQLERNWSISSDADKQTTAVMYVSQEQHPDPDVDVEQSCTTSN